MRRDGQGLATPGKFGYKYNIPGQGPDLGLCGTQGQQGLLMNCMCMKTKKNQGWRAGFDQSD